VQSPDISLVGSTVNILAGNALMQSGNNVTAAAEQVEDADSATASDGAHAFAEQEGTGGGNERSNYKMGMNPMSQRNLTWSTFVALRGNRTKLELTHHVLQQSQKVLNGVLVSKSTAKWVLLESVPAGYLSGDASIVIPQLYRTGILVQNCGNLADTLKLPLIGQLDRLRVLLSSDHKGIGGILLSYDKVSKAIGLLDKNKSQPLRRDTALLVGVRETSDMKPSTPRDFSKGHNADPDHLKAVRAREVRWQSTNVLNLYPV